MSDDPDDTTRPPKLTVGQRLLTALPNLQARRAAGAAADVADDNADHPAPADEVADTHDGDGGGEDVGTATSTTSRQRQRTRTTAAAARPNPYGDWKPDQLRRAMKYLDDRERRLAITAGPLLIGLNIALTFVTLHNNHKYINGKLNKVYESPSTILALGIGSAVVAVIVVVSAVVRRRSFTIFSLLFAGYGGGPITLLPAWGLAGWLFIRFNRMQKTLRATEGGASRPARGRAGSRSASGRGRVPANPRVAARAGAAAGRDRVAARRRGKEPATPGPTPSKRYTPPKPPRPRPPAAPD